MLDLIPISRVPAVPLPHLVLSGLDFCLWRLSQEHPQAFILSDLTEDFSKVSWSPDLSGFLRELNPSCPPCLPHQSCDTQRAGKQEKMSLSAAGNLLDLVLNPTR